MSDTECPQDSPAGNTLDPDVTANADVYLGGSDVSSTDGMKLHRPTIRPVLEAHVTVTAASCAVAEAAP